MSNNINAHLLQKYNIQFHFFYAKPISQVVFNHTNAPSTLDFKDIAVLSQSNEYLKRLYYIKNAAGRNQIFDRINMLADFYCGAAMLKYEHPMMIISKTKDIFLKRMKRLKKMIASDCSSQESSQQKSEHSSQIESFSSSQFLKSIKTNQFLQSQQDQDSLIRNCRKQQKSFDSSTHDIFDDSNLDFAITIPKNLHKKQIDKKTQLSEIESSLVNKQKSLQSVVQHLILDIDDFNMQKALDFYLKYQKHDKYQKNQKMQQLQKQIQQLVIEKNMKKQKKETTLKKSNIIITPIDNFTPQDKSQSSGPANYYPKNSKIHMKKQPMNNRLRQQYDETIRVKNNYNTNFGTSSLNYHSNHPNNLNRYQRQIPFNNRSPSFGVPNNYEQGISTERIKNSNIGPRLQNTKTNIGNVQQNYMYHKDRLYGKSPRLGTNSNINIYDAQQDRRLSYVVQPRAQLLQTLYLSHQNSELQNKQNKKQIIRQKAVALLNKVKSQQKLPIYYQQNLIKTKGYRQTQNNRFTG